jgi:hypothetical protein
MCDEAAAARRIPAEEIDMAHWSEQASRSFAAFAQDKMNWQNNADREDTRSRIMSLASQGSGIRDVDVSSKRATFTVHYDDTEIVDIVIKTKPSGVWLGDESESS